MRDVSLSTVTPTIREVANVGRRKSALSLIVICSAFCVLAFSDTASADTRQIKIKGYVTDVVSPTQFDIEDYRITRDTTFALEFDNARPELRFSPEDIRVGVELEIKGALDESTGTSNSSKRRSLRPSLPTHLSA
jgi:hypothetical protein